MVTKYYPIRNRIKRLMSLMQRFSRRICCVIFVLFYFSPVPIFASHCVQAKSDSVDWAELSLEQLMNIEINIVSRKTEKLADASAAITVITSEEIQQYGVTTIAEALRFAPGIQVARIDANKWAISTRGFNGIFANKQLVLIDGRSVYTPLFSGVFWDSQDLLLYDIEQIEVIRGPGATMWGANAVNGIINIISKHARDTANRYISFGVGTEERFFVNMRYGAALSQNLYYRIYGKYLNRDNFVYADGTGARDAWDMSRCGFRLDWNFQKNSSVTIMGDVFQENLDQTGNIVRSVNEPWYSRVDTTVNADGGNLLLRLEHAFSMTSDMTLQCYFDHFYRSDLILRGKINTVDIDFQHRFSLFKKHDIIWGMDYRYMTDETTGTFHYQLLPAARSSSIASVFIQDEYQLIKNKLRLTTGCKIEDNVYSGVEILPNIRLFCKLHSQHSLWAAVSKASRTPSRSEIDIVSVCGLEDFIGIPAFGMLTGNSQFESEKLIAYEIGYRFNSNKFSIDVASFYNDYSDLRTYEEGEPVYKYTAETPHIILPVYLHNYMEGESFGGEITVNYNMFSFLKYRIDYSYIKLNMFLSSSGLFNEMAKGTAGETPRNQVSLRTLLLILPDINLALHYSYVDVVPRLHISSYHNLNISLNWQASENIRLSITGQNLIKSGHIQYKPAFKDIINAVVERGIYSKISWVF